MREQSHGPRESQRGLTPDGELEPRFRGATLFTNREPVPLIHRIANVLFSLGFMGMFAAILLFFTSSGDSLFIHVLRIVLWLFIACWALVCLLALLGLPPFQRKRR